MSFIRTPSFFVADLLTAQRCGNSFTQKSITFTDLILYGVVTRSLTVFDEDTEAEISIYTISDGTGSIDCLLELKKNNPDETGLGKNWNDLEKLKLEADSNPKNPGLQTAYLTAVALDKVKNRSKNRILEFGSDVRIVGTLEQYKHLKYICIKEIERVSNLNEKIDSLKELLQFYNLLYNIS